MASSSRKGTAGRDVKPDARSNSHLAKLAMHYFLCGEERRGQIKEADMRKAFSLPKADFKMVVEDANKRMENVLGCKVMSRDGKMFVVNQLEPFAALRSQDMEEESKRGFLLIVLTLLFMGKNPLAQSAIITDQQFWDMLSKFDIYPDREDHYLGDISNLLGPSNTAEFVSKGWISQGKTVINDCQEQWYDWGPRALATVDPMKILKFFCKVMDDDDPKSWRAYYTKAKRMRAEMRAAAQTSENK